MFRFICLSRNNPPVININIILLKIIPITEPAKIPAVIVVVSLVVILVYEVTLSLGISSVGFFVSLLFVGFIGFLP